MSRIALREEFIAAGPYVGEIAKIEPDKRLAFGWAYITKTPSGMVLVDKQGDFVDDDWELEKAAYDFVVDHRTGDVMHNEQPVATLIESMVFTPEKIAKMIESAHRLSGERSVSKIAKAVSSSVDALPTAWWLGMRYSDGAVWNLVKSGKLRAWSIGGRGQRQKVNL